MTQDTTTTSGTAELRATFSEMLVDLPNTEPYTLFKAGFDAALAAGRATVAQQSGAKLNYSVLYVYASQHGIDYNSLCVAVREASAQPAAQQGVAYAEPPTSSYAGRVHEEGFLIGTCPLYTADQMRAFADATHTLRASHGQAPAGAGEPFGYFHQLLNHEGKGNGVWLGAAERKVVEQAHTPGETSEEIVTLYTAPQPTQTQPVAREPLSHAQAKADEALRPAAEIPAAPGPADGESNG